MIRFVIVVYLATFVLEAPLRYLLNSVGLEMMIYLRDILLIVTILYILVQHGFRSWIEPVFWVVVGLMMFHVLVAFFNGLGVFQVLFGLKIFLPMLFFLLVYSSIKHELEKLTTPMFVLFLIACGGVYVNALTPYPWEGLRYVVGGVEVEASRSWYTMGIEVKRIAGLSRSSFEAGIQAMLLGSFLVAFVGKPHIKVLVWLMAGAAIALTTSKGIGLAYLALTAFLIFRMSIPNYGNMYQKAMFIPLSIVMLAPLVSGFLYEGASRLDATQKFFFYSYIVRMEETWPRAFNLLADTGSEIFGRGIGGIGAAQKVFEGFAYNPGDNIFVYAYVSFGIFSIFYFLFVLLKSQYLVLSRGGADLFAYMCISSALIFGLIANVIDSGIFTFFLGFALAHISGLTAKDAESRSAIWRGTTSKVHA